RTGRYRVLPLVSTAILTIGLVLLGLMRLDTPAWQVAAYMFLVGAGIGPVNAVAVTATQNAVPKAMVGVATASITLFRQVGGSIGVSLFGALFAFGLESRIAAAGADAAASFGSEAFLALPASQRAELIE